MLIRQFSFSSLCCGIAAWAVANTGIACDCQPGIAAAVELAPLPAVVDSPVSYTRSRYAASPQVAAAPGPVESAQRSGVLPPSGTLGQTYLRPSYPIPVDKHPRVGMITVAVPGATNVVVRDTNPYRMEDKLTGWQDRDDPGVWHFESDPLLPGLPHIHEVEATFIGSDGQETTERRQARLIMGRIVTLEF